MGRALPGACAGAAGQMRRVTAGDSGRGGGRRRVHALCSAGPGGSSDSVRAWPGGLRRAGRTRRHARPPCLAAAAARVAKPGRQHVDPGRRRPGAPASVDGPVAGAALGRGAEAPPGCRSRGRAAPLDKRLPGRASPRRRRWSRPREAPGAVGAPPRRQQVRGA